MTTNDLTRALVLAFTCVVVGPGCAGSLGTGSRAVPVDAGSLAPRTSLTAFVAQEASGAGPAIEATLPPPTSADLGSVTEVEAATRSPWARFGFSVGGILAAVDSAVRVGLPGVGVSVNLEELLDIDASTNTLRLEAFWRYTENKRHRVDLSWIDLSRTGTTSIGQDLDLGDGNVIPLGSQINSKLDLNLIKVQYAYSIFQDDRFDLALSGGIYVAPIDFGLDVTGAVALDTSFGVTAPLPVVGFRMDFALTEKWYIRSDANVFYVEFGGVTGAITSWTFGAEYRPWDHVAFGLGADSFRIRVQAGGSTSVPGIDEAGSVEFGYVGLAMYVKTLW